MPIVAGVCTMPVCTVGHPLTLKFTGILAEKHMSGKAMPTAKAREMVSFCMVYEVPGFDRLSISTKRAEMIKNMSIKSCSIIASKNKAYYRIYSMNPGSKKG
jgi:hypothetical protein